MIIGINYKLDILLLTVKLTMKTAAPKFPSVKDGPYDVNVTEGESVTFDCNAFAKPQAINVWLKNGKPIDSESNLQHKSTGSIVFKVSMPVVHNVRPATSLCVARESSKKIDYFRAVYSASQKLHT